jgi:hypothetical protein
MVSDGDGGTDSEVLNLHIYDFVLDLDEGWNLISFPLIPTDTNVENVFDSVKENLNKIWVYKYDENTGKNVWYYKTYNEDWEGSEEFVDVEPGFGYFVEMSNYDSVSFDGSKMSGFGIPPSQTVVPGWNLIGHYGMKTDVSKSNAFTDSLSSYYSTMLDDEGNPQDSLNPTNGYWLFITETSNRLYAPSAFSYAY